MPKQNEKKPKQNKINYIIDENNCKISNEKEISNYMNEYFCEIGSKLEEKLSKLLIHKSKYLLLTIKLSFKNLLIIMR